MASKKDMTAPRRGSVQQCKNIAKIKKMKEQTIQKEHYHMKEFEKNGEKHYLLVKNKPKNSVDDVEDIFSDWNQNLNVIKRPRNITPRVRKLTHRGERKELLKSVEKQEPFGPLTYSQMLKKGLKLPTDQELVEDIFQNWRLFLNELTDITEPKKEVRYGWADELDYFKMWKHNLHVPADRMEDVDILSTTHHSLLPPLDCGQPTVKTPVMKKKAGKNISPPKQKTSSRKSPARDVETTKVETAMAEVDKVEVAKVEVAKLEFAKVEVAKVEAPKETKAPATKEDKKVKK